MVRLKPTFDEYLIPIRAGVPIAHQDLDLVRAEMPPIVHRPAGLGVAVDIFIFPGQEIFWRNKFPAQGTHGHYFHVAHNVASIRYLSTIVLSTLRGGILHGFPEQKRIPQLGYNQAGESLSVVVR